MAPFQTERFANCRVELREPPQREAVAEDRWFSLQAGQPCGGAHILRTSTRPVCSSVLVFMYQVSQL